MPWSKPAPSGNFIRIFILASSIFLLLTVGWSQTTLNAISQTKLTTSGVRPAYGLLWLQTNPEAVDIALDGLFLDKDVWLVSVAPGNHWLHVRKPGFAPFNTRFLIGPGQSVRLDVSLQPLLQSPLTDGLTPGF